jgi:hypothetical protein
MNGSTNGTGIVPTIDLATNNGAYPVMMGGYGNSGFGYGSDWLWVIVLLALFGGWGNNGNGGFFGNNAFDNGYAWLSNGQKEIMQNTNNGFDTLHLSNQLDTVNSGIYSLSNQLCNCCADMNQTLSNGFYNAEISANNRQMANMNTAFDLSRQFADCCCENRLGLANLNSTIISENCADRQALNEGVRDILANQTASVQRILDQLCQDKIDAKNDTIAQLRQELLYARGQASQIEQTAELRRGQEAEVDALYNRLSNCPVGTVPVYGRQPIFTCNNGCGCSGSIYGTNV